MSFKYQQFLTKEFFEREYIQKQKTIKEIAKEYNIDCATLLNYIKQYNIKIRPGRFKDLSGQKYGDWLVIKYYDQAHSGSRWLCRCQCGKEAIVSICHLKFRTRQCYECYKSKHKIKIKEEFRPEVYFRQVKSNLKNRSLDFNLDIDYIIELLIKQNYICAISGLKISLNWRNYKEQSASLDRIDSSKGYIKGNVQWVHKGINTLKSSLTDDEFIAICQTVSQHHQNTNLNIKRGNHKRTKSLIDDIIKERYNAKSYGP